MSACRIASAVAMTSAFAEWAPRLMMRLESSIARYIVEPARVGQSQRVAQSERGRVGDPRLLAVRDEIDPYAQVELAKPSALA